MGRGEREGKGGVEFGARPTATVVARPARPHLTTPFFTPPRSPAPLPSPCSDINDKHRRLAEITEMIHTASLVHDDVLDDCDTRRGEKEGGERMRRPAVRFFFFFRSPPRPGARAPLKNLRPSPLLLSSPRPNHRQLAVRHPGRRPRGRLPVCPVLLVPGQPGQPGSHQADLPGEGGSGRERERGGGRGGGERGERHSGSGAAGARCFPLFSFLSLRVRSLSLLTPRSPPTPSTPPPPPCISGHRRLCQRRDRPGRRPVRHGDDA